MVFSFHLYVFLGVADVQASCCTRIAEKESIGEGVFRSQEFKGNARRCSIAGAQQFQARS
jgi:hypothetical protein